MTPIECVWELEDSSCKVVYFKGRCLLFRSPDAVYASNIENNWDHDDDDGYYFYNSSATGTLPYSQGDAIVRILKGNNIIN
jgi:hypothetical protein